MAAIKPIDVNQVLKDSDLVNINESLDAIEAAKELIIRAEQAGIDVTAQKSRFDDLDKRLRATKAAFFPNR